MVPLARPEPTDYNNGPLSRVQVNFFPCGGVAITVQVSHKIGDGASYSSFIKAWSEIALGSSNTVVPDFTAVSSRFPPVEDFPVTSLTFSGKGPKVVSKKFVVDATKITDLKSKSAMKRITTHRGMFQIIIDNDDDDYESEVTDMSGLVCNMRKGVEESVMKNNNLSTKATPQAKKEYEMEMYCHSSWCGFSVYKVDFGWGTPTWVGIVGQASIIPPGMALMDTRDGEGVEIWLTLIEEDMAIVEANQELLHYASPNKAAL
ncbi:Vinorine synthase [Camellia lanceoleosa]|uniref:Vinorine synthase n=1 Tax=Camellia lanceoleosa TaxID=1840588 RepID=A0ACC0FYD8_9ERIC|nr:Vinorine synthase [Camellia lanceoleosa]